MKRDIDEDLLDYSIPVFNGSHVGKTDTKKLPLTLAYVDDESGVEKRDREQDLAEADSSTTRMRRYNRKNRKKVRAYLRKTQKDRVARNRDRRKAVKKHGKAKMKNHDVHHPNGPHNGGARLVRKDHGRDKVNEVFTTLSENFDVDQIKNFVRYAASQLKLKTPPTVKIIQPQPELGTLGQYSPTDNVLSVVVKDRLLADILRTVAHEMTHHKQYEMGYIKNPEVDGVTGSPIENKANIIAGILLRNYGKQNKFIFVKKSLNEGGVAGHLAHPFEDESLKFSDMKDIISRGLLGGLDQEAPVTEKLDGQNLAFSVRDGSIVFARNKSHVKAKGKNALDFAGIRQMFNGKPEVQNAFTLAAEDLMMAVKSLSPEQMTQLFQNGEKFFSLEVILPDTKNVIPYGKSVLIVHDNITYNENGVEIARTTDDVKYLVDALTKIGANKQKEFGISGPHTIVFNGTEVEYFTNKAREYAIMLNRLMNQYNLEDSNTLSDYRKLWWAREIQKEIERLGLQLSRPEVESLIERWAENNKQFSLKDIFNDSAKKWARQYEKDHLKSSQKKMIRPIETVFLKAGADTLHRVTNFLSANNPVATARIKADILNVIKTVRDSNDLNKLEHMRNELERLRSIGIENIVPSEGIVFIYKGKPYKFTGTFAPINQIIGTLRFKKGSAKKQTPMSTSDELPVATQREIVKAEVVKDVPVVEQGPPRTVAIFAGRFQPFHAGHYSIYEGLVEKFGKDNVFIVATNVTDPVKSPFKFTDKREIMANMFDIPTDAIVQVKNPFSPVEILNNLPKNTIYVTAVSKKDSDRFTESKYFCEYDSVPKNKHRFYMEQGYYTVCSEMAMNIDGKNLSGTALRSVFGNPTITERAKQEIFTKVYGKFDKKIYNKIKKTCTESEEANRLGKLYGETSSTEPEPEVITEEQNNKKSDVTVYTHVRDYTTHELHEESDEYFKDKKTQELFPDLAQSEAELMDKIIEADTTVLDKEQLMNLQHSNVFEIFNSKNKVDSIKKLGQLYEKDLLSIAKAVKNKEKMAMPIVIQYSNGQYLLAGNARLSFLAALNATMPVKILDYKGEVSQELLNIQSKKLYKEPDEKKGAREVFKDLLQMKINNPETGNLIKIDTAMDYKKTHPAHQIALATIRNKMAGLSKRAGIPKDSGPKT